ncbi:MAG: UvrD-helicase domain-containing protein, partial [Firmicutes bacterium]|nr:UvrD-helicase domain-containing protein [Bacillota bacterium]
MPWTERQKDAIESRNETLLVSAAAGSGKTAVLVERVMGLIMNDRVGLDRMLIVTFTNAAAAEMKEKIGTRIRRSLQKDDLSPEDRRFLRSQLAAMGSCNISTFHKFAIEVVHRYYHIIGVSPDLAVCDESRAEILKREAMDELFEERFASGDGELRFFLDRYSGSRSDEEARNMILGFRDVMMSLPEPEEWMKSLEDGTLLDAEVFGGMVRDIISRSLDDAKLMLREAGRLLREGPADVGLPPAFSYAEKNAADISAVDSMKDALLRSPEEAVSMAAGCRFMTMSGKNADKPSWEYVRERVQALRKEAKALIGDMTDMLEGYTDGLLEKEKEAMLPVLRTL